MSGRSSGTRNGEFCDEKVARRNHSLDVCSSGMYSLWFKKRKTTEHQSSGGINMVVGFGCEEGRVSVGRRRRRQIKNKKVVICNLQIKNFHQNLVTVNFTP